MAFKIDQEWRQALSMLPKSEASRALEMIEEYRRTGTVPSGMSYNMRMIFLLVKPTLDRRRRASESARRRREERRRQPQPKPQESVKQVCGAQDYGAAVCNLRNPSHAQIEAVNLMGRRFLTSVIFPECNTPNTEDGTRRLETAAPYCNTLPHRDA